MFLLGIQSVKLFAHSIWLMMLSKPSYRTMIIIAFDWHLREPKSFQGRNQAKTLTPNFVSLVKDCLWSFPLLIHSQLSPEIWQCWRHFLNRIIRYVLILRNLLRAVSPHMVWSPFFFFYIPHKTDCIGNLVLGSHIVQFSTSEMCVHLFICWYFIYIQSMYCQSFLVFLMMSYFLSGSPICPFPWWLTRKQKGLFL